MPKSNRAAARADLHQDVTNRIIAMLEKANANNAELPWCRPGVAYSRPTNAETKKRYSGINTLTLWAQADASNYTTGLWATYKQWSALGAQVRKGEAATPIIFYKPLEINDVPAAGKCDPAAAGGDGATRTIRMIRGYWGFNADQVDGYDLPAMPTDDLVTRLAHADEFFGNTGIPVTHGGSSAYYRPADDRIQMPAIPLFRNTTTSTATEGYYGVLGHEMAHATGIKKRLDRDLSGRFGSSAYAMEELVATLCSAVICADLQITPQPRMDHAHYIANWITVLAGDSSAIFTAAAAANRAADWLHSVQPPAPEIPACVTAPAPPCPDTRPTKRSRPGAASRASSRKRTTRRPRAGSGSASP